jgi:hypothetical protein
MAHFAEIDENNIVTRVLVTDTNDPNGDEGYQFLLDAFGGRWVKTSYNTLLGQHLLGGTPFRGNFAGVGSHYIEEIDMFLPKKPFESWIPDVEKYTWKAPSIRPDSGFWTWDEENVCWIEGFAPELEQYE